MRNKPVVPVLLIALTALFALVGAQAASAFTTRGSIGEVYLEGAKAKQKVELLGSKSGKVLKTGKADRFGSYIFRDLVEGAKYKVRVGSSTKSATVLKAGDNPKESFYKSLPKLKAGLNYVKMRDGVELAMTVRLPAGKTLDDGPFPTVIEYSGYQVAAPGDLLSSIVGGKPDPLAPASGTIIGSALAPLLGYASVSVQMRGSGCSGGAFDLFDLPTTYDGYDAVETIAAQPWAKGGMVGLVGISFSGISQIFVAGARPPHLAAIAPMSITDDLYNATGYPGGIFNSGFALSWIKERVADAKPAPEGGQPYARELVKRGDKNCAANQKLRLQTQDVLDLIRKNPYRTPSLFDDRAPEAWMSKINVPTFLVGAFQDEQTGGRFASSLYKLANNDRTWLSLMNGVHVDSLGPSTVTRWFEFLELYVADQVPVLPQTILGLSSALYTQVSGAASIPVVQTRFEKYTSVNEARAVYEKDPAVRLYMDNGGSSAGLGSMGATWEIDADEWPIANAPATSYYLGSGGALSKTKPSSSTAAYTGNTKARPMQTLGGTGEGDAWAGQPPYNWAPVAAGKGLGWATPALTSDLIIAGSSSFDVYIKSSAKDTDLQVTLSEIRPDGKETYVQNGWLRASHRKLGPDSTALQPAPTHLKQDAAPLPKGKYTLVRIPLFPVAHAFRAGSRLRVTLQAPGGDRPRWAFSTIEKGKTKNTVALGGARASKLVLPVLAGADAKGTPLPAPTALRGEPSRTYVAAANGG